MMIDLVNIYLGNTFVLRIIRQTFKSLDGNPTDRGIKMITSHLSSKTWPLKVVIPLVCEVRKVPKIILWPNKNAWTTLKIRSCVLSPALKVTGCKLQRGVWSKLVKRKLSRAGGSLLQTCSAIDNVKAQFNLVRFPAWLLPIGSGSGNHSKSNLVTSSQGPQVGDPNPTQRRTSSSHTGNLS